MDRIIDGLYLGDYGPDDANADIGDSAITETAGIGGFAMATAPGATNAAIKAEISQMTAEVVWRGYSPCI